MKALLCKAYGPPESLVVEDVADPVAGPGGRRGARMDRGAREPCRARRDPGRAADEQAHAIATAPRLSELEGLVADGSLEVPIARTFPLTQVRDAYRELAARHTHGKIVLIP